MGFISWLFKRKEKDTDAQPAVPPADERAEPPPEVDAWQVFGASVRGASHERASLPNQDAIGWWPESAAGPPLLLAVADGHGSVKCFRSDVGSRLGVETALQILQEFVEGQSEPSDLTAVKRAIEEQLPVAIERRWKQAVERHLEENPLLVKEVARLEDDAGTAARKAVEENPILAYGATILALLVQESFVACLQLGDGDILVVTDTGQIVRPMEDDARLFANETTSLSSADCWRDFRTYFQVWADAQPALLMASTDGYSNAFSSDAGFLAVGSDLLELLRSEGLEKVKEDLSGWLEEASRQGSGDDVTAGVLCRTAALKPRDQAQDLDEAQRGTERTESGLSEGAAVASESGDQSEREST